MANFVEVKAIDYDAAPNELTTKTYHGLQILVNNITVGRITSYTPPNLSRTVTPVRELTPAGQANGAFGRPIEMVPGISGDDSYKIAVERTEVWSNELERAFGFEATFLDLCDQTTPFSMEERLYRGTTAYQTFIYTGCWFDTHGIQAFTADGDAIVKTNASVTYTSRRKSV